MRLHLFLLFISLKPDHVYTEMVMGVYPEMFLPLQSNIIVEVAPIVTNISQIPLRHGSNVLLSPYLSEGLESCYSFLTSLFRTTDGSCNNRDLGRSNTKLARLLPPAFGDGRGSPRNSSILSSSLPLPSARVVSQTIHPDKNATSNLTIFVMQFGQFMDHEMVSTPLPIEDTRGTVQCCGDNFGPPPNQTNSECFPILFPGNDTSFQGTCMEFVRSQPIRDSNGSIIYPRENRNAITSFIDASTVYGSTSEVLQKLRDPEKPYLLLTTKNDNFLPDSGTQACVKRTAADICHMAGDDRVNELPGLTLLHAVFMRYHNFIASELRAQSSYLSDELVFQQARSVVGAVMENILYSEWLPLVLGPSVRREFELDLHNVFRTEFYPDVDPQIFQAFSTAVFRFGHTLIPRSVPLNATRYELLRDLFFKPYETRENMDTLTQGFLTAANPDHRTQPFDRFIVEEVTNHLFENQEGARKGFDLVALNIQRARDHGVPPYNAFRQAVGLPKVTSFSDPVLGDGGARLARIYAHVDDIDLFSGGLAEAPYDCGLPGETFSRLMAMQFHRLKFGDKFFFSHRKAYFGFTDTRYKLIRRITLAHVLCRTTKIKKVQRNAFRIVDLDNKEVSCDELNRDHPSMYYFANHPW